MAGREYKQLPIQGNSPAFPEPIRVGVPSQGDSNKLMNRIGDVLELKWLTNNGPCVREFEEKIAERLGVRHCVAVCNATIGLQVAAKALDLTGEVIVPGFTFIATPHSLEWLGINPIFCDIDLNTHNIDPWLIANLITPKTSAILGVHLWGRPCQIDLLQELADQYHLKLLFDAAHAFGSSYKGRMVGNFGELEVISFHATKYVHTLEGGVIVTNNYDLARKVRSMRNFGFDEENYSVNVGTNAKMNEFSAAMGLVLLEDMDQLTERNYQVYKEYERELNGIPGITLVRYDENERGNYQYIIIEVDEERTGVNRDQLMTILASENVFTRRYFYPGCHRMEPYLSRNIQPRLVLPNTERVANRVLALPAGDAGTPENIKKICQIIATVINQGLNIRETLSSISAVSPSSCSHVVQ